MSQKIYVVTVDPRYGRYLAWFDSDPSSAAESFISAAEAVGKLMLGAFEFGIVPIRIIDMDAEQKAAQK